MFDEPPPVPATQGDGNAAAIVETVPQLPGHVCSSYTIDPAQPNAVRCEPVPVLDVPPATGGTVIDLTRLAPPPPSEPCDDDQPDPLNPVILVCADTGPAPRIGPVVGPVDDGFASAIPRARIKLSDNAEAEANLISQGVGGFDADGGEVRVKIDF